LSYTDYYPKDIRIGNTANPLGNQYLLVALCHRQYSEKTQYHHPSIMDSAFAIADEQRYRDRALELPNSIDLSHHLSSLAKNRQSSALKDLYRYAARPGMIGLAGGLPNPEIFPFLELSAQVYTHDALSITPATANVDGGAEAHDAQSMVKKQSFLSWLFGKKSTTETITIGKQPASASPLDINLNTLLQYSSAQGHPALQAFIREFVSKVYQPAFADWDVLLNIGSTMAWSQVVFMLLEPGDGVLYEEWSYPGAMNTASPLPTHKVS
jgi:aromatic amino acid aminotransferase I